MQTAVPTQSPSIQKVRIIGLHSVFAVVNIDEDQPVFPQLEANWPIGSRSYDELSTLHEVSDPPPFAENPRARMLLLQFSEDYFEQAFVDDVLIVISIVQQEPVRKERVKAAWAPRKLTRHGALEFLRVSWFCDQPTVLCFLYHNNRPWVIEDTSIHHLAHGDHIRLQYRSSSYSWCDIEHSETITRSRRVFLSSDEETESRPPHAEEGPRSHPSDRSRSPGRHTDQGSEEESLSLLQLQAVSIPHAKRVEQGRAKQCQRPHVSDLWGANDTVSAPPPQVLTLDDKIGRPRDYVHIQCSEAMRSWQQFQALHLPPFLGRDCVAEWHTSTAMEWPTIADWNGEHPTGFRFYLDGSSIYDSDQGTRTGAAATVLLVDTPLGERFGGIQGRLVPLPSTSPLAEMWALLQAVLWAISLTNQYPWVTDIALFGDATGPGHFAQGDWTPKVHQKFANACRDLIYWIQERSGASCQWFHVAAHTGHPWNEAADTIAAAIAKQELEAPTCEDLWNELSHNDTRSWTWSWFWFFEKVQAHQDPGLRLCNQDLLLRLPHHEQCNTQQLRLSQDLCEYGKAPGQHPLTGSLQPLKMMTINVLSLFAGTDEKVGSGNYVSARMEAIERQCQEHGFEIIGLQETRHRADHYFQLDHYHVLSGPATPKRTGGTQLWIAKTAFGLCIDKSHLRTLFAGDRILTASIQHPQLQLGLVVLHAPSSDHPEVLDHWWSEVDKHIKMFMETPYIVMMDANSRVGSVVL